jgi:hypothetical protein
MKKTKTLSIILVALIFPLIFLACNNKSKPIDTVKPEFDSQFKTAYPQDKVFKTVLTFRVNQNEVNPSTEKFENFAVNRVTRTFDDSLNYHICKLKEGGYFYVFFGDTPTNPYGKENTSGHVYGATAVKSNLTEYDYEKFKNADYTVTMETIFSLDKGAKDYYNALSAENSIPLPFYSDPVKTFHIIEEGFAVITYSNKKIDEVTVEFAENENLTAEERTDLKSTAYSYRNFIVEDIKIIPNGKPVFEDLTDTQFVPNPNLTPNPYAYSDPTNAYFNRIPVHTYTPFNSVLLESDFPFV